MAAQNFKKTIKLALKMGHVDVWGRLAPNETLAPEPPKDLRSRDLLTYALLLCEHNAIKWGSSKSDYYHGNHLKDEFWSRLGPIITFAQQMQSRSGNFRWFWESKVVRDPNAVEFCMRAASLMCARHGEAIREHNKPAWERFQEMVYRASRALWRPVPEKHTNISLMNAANLIMIGESMGWDRIKEEGCTRLDRILIYTWEWGIHEYASPTYSAIQVSSIEILRRFAQKIQNHRLEEQTKALGSFLWDHIQSNWIPGTRGRNPASGRLGGASSRQISSYVKGEGRIDDTIWLTDADYEPPPPTFNDGCLPMRFVYPAIAHLLPGTDFGARSPLADNLNPPTGSLTIKERWGMGKHESRTMYRGKAVFLSTSGAGYDHPNRQDMPLTVDFKANRTADRESKVHPKTYPNRCYILSDVQHDPYGADDSHHKPLVWTATQNDNDALGFVLYEAKPRRRLETHFVMPIEDGDKILFHSGGIDPDANPGPWFDYVVSVGEGATTVKRLGAEGALLDDSIEFDWGPREGKLGNPDPTVILIKKDAAAAVGLRMVWGRNLKGRWPRVRLYFEGEAQLDGKTETVDSLRMTVLHHQLKGSDSSESEKARPWKNAGGAFWVHVKEQQDLLNGTELEDYMRKKMNQDRDTVFLRDESDRFRRGSGNVYERLRVSVWPDGDRKATSNPSPTLKASLFSVDGRRYFVTDLKPETTQCIRENGQPTALKDLESVKLIDVYRDLFWAGFLRDRLLRERIKNLDPADETTFANLLKRYGGPLRIGEEKIPNEKGSGYLDLHEARIWDPMKLAVEPGPHGDYFAWMPPGTTSGSDVGSVTWNLEFAEIQNTEYFVWGRIESEREGAFNVAICEMDGKTRPRNKKLVQRRLSTWRTGKLKKWTWVALDTTEIGNEAGPSPLKFGTKYVHLQLFAKRAGTRISHLFITSDPDEIPTDKERKEKSRPAGW